MRPKVLLIAASVLALTLGLPAGPLAAQQVSVLPGSRVRVTAATLVAPLVANFLEQRDDTLIFIEEGTGPGVWTFAITQIEKLETTGGQGSRNRHFVARGTVIGAGAGFVAGLLFAAAARPSDPGRTYDRPVTGLVGAAIGAGIGAFIGSRQQQERWLVVPLPGRLSLSPDGSGLRIGLNLR